MIGLLEVTQRAGKVRITRAGVAVIIRRVLVSISPGARHRVAADGQFRSRRRIAQIQFPAQRIDLLAVGVQDLVKTPAHAISRVVGDGEQIVHRGDDRVSVEQGAGVGRRAVNGNVKTAVLERGGDQRDAVFQVAGRLGEGEIDELIRDGVEVDGDISIPTGGCDVDLPGNLLHGHLHQEGFVTVIVDSETVRVVEGNGRNGLLARIQRDVQSRTAHHPDEILAPHVQVGGHDQHLAVLQQVVSGRVVRNRRQRGFDQQGVVQSVKTQLPGQRVAGNGRLEERHALGPDGRIRATAGGRQRRQLLDVGLAGHEVPLRIRRGLDQDVPVLARGELLALRQNKPVGSRQRRGVVVRAGRGHRSLEEIKAGMVALDVEGIAPNSVGGGFGGDLEKVRAAGRALVGIDLCSGLSRSRIPRQGGDRCQFRPQHVIGRTRRAGREIDPYKISPRRGLPAEESDRVNGLSRALHHVRRRAGQLPPIDVYAGRSGVRGTDHNAPARQQVRGHVHLEVLPCSAAAIGQVAGGRKNQPLGDRIIGRAKIGKIGTHDHVETLTGGACRRENEQAVIARGELRRLQIDLIGHADKS